MAVRKSPEAADLSMWLRATWAAASRAELRSSLCSDAFRLSLDHHRAIASLVATEQFSSAWSLLRCQHEAWLQAVWLGAVATDEEVVRVGEGRDMPLAGVLIAEVREVPGLGTVVERHDANWKVMSSHLHGGRWHRIRTRASRSTDVEAAELLDAADYNALAAICDMTNLIGPAAQRVEAVRRLAGRKLRSAR